MRVRIDAAALAAALSVMAACSHTMGHVDHLALEQTPAPVLDGFHREFPGLKLLHTDKVTGFDNTVKYDLKFRDARNEYKRKLFSSEGVLQDGKADVAMPAQSAVTTPTGGPQ